MTRRVLLVLPLLAFLGLAALLAAADPLRPTESPSAPFGRSWRTRAVIQRYAGWASFSDPINGRLHTAGPSRVLVYDTGNGHLVGQYDFVAEQAFLPHAFDTSYERLYVVAGLALDNNRQVIIRVLDAVTAAQISQVRYTCPPDMAMCLINGLAVGPAGRLYLARAGAPVLDVVDSATGQILHTLDTGGPPVERLGLAASGATLFASRYFDATENRHGLAVLDISAVVPVRTGFYPLDSHLDPILSPGGEYLFLGGVQYRTQPFEHLWSTTDDFAGYFADGRVLVADDDSDRPGWKGYRALDAATGAPARGMGDRHAAGEDEILFAQPLPGDDLAVYYLERIELQRPIDHAVALPIQMNRACFGGAVVDRFLDPTSGWPIISAGPITTRYFDSSYRITLRDAGLWTAVSRGDYWYRADLAAALGHTLGDPLRPTGVTGFVYGLNDDWSDFYTVEISLHNSRYAHYHYHDGEWELLGEGYGIGGVTSPVLVGLDRRRDTGEVILRVGTEEVYAVDEVPGRVGILAGSFVPGVEARFTQYEFHGENCVPNGSRDRPLQFAPAHVARTHPLSRK